MDAQYLGEVLRDLPQLLAFYLLVLPHLQLEVEKLYRNQALVDRDVLRDLSKDFPSTFVLTLFCEAVDLVQQHIAHIPESICVVGEVPASLASGVGRRGLQVDLDGAG